MKNKILFLVFALTLFGFMACGIIYQNQKISKSVTMRVLTLRGNELVSTTDYYSGEGRFLFFLSHGGVFYLDTTDGRVWSFQNGLAICPEQLAIVEKNLEDLERRGDR